MKLKFIYCLLFLSAGLGSVSGQTKKATTVNSKKTSTVAKKTVTPPPPLLKNSKDSLSYALGVDVANSLKNTGFEVNSDVFYKGLIANFNNNPLLLTEDQNANIIQSEVRKAYERKSADLKKPGQDFLDKNKLRPEIKATSEGVQYEILKEGDGAQPTADSEVEVHYKGSLIDGTQFDSSYDRNEPLTLNLNQVIEGWKIGIPLMKVGSKYKFYVPYNLAYGERNTGSIPAYSTLIFEVELLAIK